MNPQTTVVDMLKTPISVQFADAKELFTPQTIATTPYILLLEATPDEATIPTCIDFNLSLSAIQKNAANLELYRVYIIKQIQLQLGVQGAALYTVRLLGAEGKVALAFPYLAKQIFDDLAKGLVPERMQGVEKEQAKEGEGSLAKEGVLMQQDIRLFSGKKAKIAQNETQKKEKNLFCLRLLFVFVSEPLGWRHKRTFFSLGDKNELFSLFFPFLQSKCPHGTRVRNNAENNNHKWLQRITYVPSLLLRLPRLPPFSVQFLRT